MECTKETKAFINEGRQKRAGFRQNKKFNDCRIAAHVEACVNAERAYRRERGEIAWQKWIPIHEIAKSVSKHASELSSLYGDYFESGRITRGAAEIRQLHDYARQVRAEGVRLQYGLIPAKNGKRELAILISKSPVRAPWGSAPRITRAYWA